MPTLTFDFPAEFTLAISPRDDAYGERVIDIARIQCIPELFRYGLTQKLRDSVSDKKGKSVSEVHDMFAKCLDQLYAGEWRARGEAAEPTDPVEAKCYREAKKAIMALLKDTPQWSDKAVYGDNKGDDKMVIVLNYRRTRRHEAPSDDVLQETIDAWLDRNPDVRKEAIRQVKAEAANRAKATEAAADLI